MKLHDGNALSFAKAEVCQLLTLLVDHHPLQLTSSDIVEMFVPDHLKEMAINGRKHFDIGALTANRVNIPMRVDHMNLTLILNVRSRDTTPLLPRQPLPLNMHDERAQVLAEWVRFRVDVGKQFAVAQETLSWMGDKCETLSQVAFFLPAIQTLLARAANNQMASVLERLRKAKKPRVLPAIPPWVRDGCQIATSIISAAALLPEFKGEDPEVIPWISIIDPFDFHGRQLQPS